MIQHLNHSSTFDAAGPPHAFPIVFIHGAAWTRNMWLPQMAALSDAFRVIAIDLPGHGTLRSEPFRLASAIHATITAINNNGDTAALLVGLSLGGYIAMACAQQYPAQIAGLVLSGCCIDYRGAIGLLSQLDSFIATTLFSDHRLTQLQEKTLRSMLPETLLEPQIAAGFSWKVMPSVYRELASHNFQSMLHTYLGPILIANGEHDTHNRKGEARLLRHVQNSQLQTIKQAHHLCNLEQPEAFTNLVRSFAQPLSETHGAAFYNEDYL